MRPMRDCAIAKQSTQSKRTSGRPPLRRRSNRNSRRHEYTVPTVREQEGVTELRKNTTNFVV